MKGNDLAACLVIALGVGGTIIGSLLAPVNEPVTLPAVNPQPVMMETPAPEPTTTPKPTPEPTPTVETVHFSATGDDLIHDGIFLQARKNEAATTTILTPPMPRCRATTTSLT